MAENDGPSKARRSPSLDHAESESTRKGDTRTYDEIQTIRTGKIRPMESGGYKPFRLMESGKRKAVPPLKQRETERVEVRNEGGIPAYKRGGMKRKAGIARVHEGEKIARVGTLRDEMRAESKPLFRKSGRVKSKRGNRRRAKSGRE